MKAARRGQIALRGDKLIIPLPRPRAIGSPMDFKGYARKFDQSAHSEAPPSRKKFENDWDELKYLYHKILYWFYNRGVRRKAYEFRDRFAQVTKKLALQHPDGILIEECWAILNELDGNLASAIDHREREIELILRLWNVSINTPAREHALFGYGVDALCDRLELLSILYHDAGKLDRAIVHLVESQRLCQSAGIPFEGHDLLTDYLDEREPRLAVLLCGEPSQRN